MSTLREENDILVLKISGDSFDADLAKAKETEGRRYNPENKTWEFPNDPDVLMKLAFTLEPTMSAELMTKVKASKADIQAELLTQLPDDAELQVPWADRLVPRQRSGVEFMVEHPHTILADGMGGGKSVQAITAVHEAELRASMLLGDNIQNEDMPELQSGAPGRGVLVEFVNLGWPTSLLQGVPKSETTRPAQGGDGSPSQVQGTAVRGLRDSTTAGVHGSGSRPAAKVWSNEPGVESQNDAGGAGSLRAAVSELSSFAALPRLIVSPNSVTGHWKAEIEKWTGDTTATVLSGSSDKKRQQLAEALKIPGAWVVVNWESIRLLPELAKVKWFAVIADEAHRAKNRKAKMTKALWKLRAPVQLALTGTPIMSSPGDLWALLKWIRPQQYTSYWAFIANYAETYSGFRGKQIVIGVKNADSLRFELSDKLVRRTKREIHSDIPEPFPPKKRIIPMTTKQAAVYQEALKDFWLEIAAEIPDIADAEEMDEGKVRDDLVAALEDPQGLEKIKYMINNPAARLTRLRQVATSPALLGGEDESGKLDAVIETITDAEDDLPFVAFAWYKPTVRLLLERLEAKGITAKGFTGDTPVAERQQMATDFQNGEFQVIIPTLATGGVGIDLFRSSDPLLVEEDWTPAINQQAIDRCDRKGQTNSVQPQFFRSMDTVETGRLAPKLALKQNIIDTVLGA